MNNQYLDQLKKFFLEEFEDDNIKIVVFGSRARGEETVGSDVDIGIISVDSLNGQKLTLVKEKIEQLNLPYNVDVVDLSQSSEKFRSDVLKDAIVWKE